MSFKRNRHEYASSEEYIDYLLEQIPKSSSAMAGIFSDLMLSYSKLSRPYPRRAVHALKLARDEMKREKGNMTKDVQKRLAEQIKRMNKWYVYDKLGRELDSQVNDILHKFKDHWNKETSHENHITGWLSNVREKFTEGQLEVLRNYGTVIVEDIPGNPDIMFVIQITWPDGNLYITTENKEIADGR